MPDELPDVPALRTLTPPAGGLAALRDRIDDAPHHRRRWWRAAIPALAVAIALVVLGRVLVRRPDARTPAAPPTALRDRQVGGDVAFYWVASRPGAARVARAIPARPEVAPAIAIDAVSTVAYLQLP